MARDLIKFSNDKKGFRALLVVEGLVAAWSISATLYAVVHGRTSTMIYGCITMFAAFYIFGRSLRSYREFARREREENRKEGESK